MRIFFTGILFLLVSNAVYADFRNELCSDDSVTLEDLNRVSDPSRFSPTEFSQWFLSPVQPTRGVVIVAHGLNLKPSKMDPIVNILQSMGMDVLRVSLAGHRGNVDEMKHVTALQWQQEMFDHYCMAQKRAHELSVKLYFVGYSLGALVIENLMNIDLMEKLVFDRMVLFAPAQAVRFYSHFIKAFNLFGGSFIVPSQNLEEYRSNPGTSVAAYDALFDLQDQLENSKFKNSHLPALVFVDPKDELVSYDGIISQMKGSHLAEWEMIPVSNEGSPLPKTYHHLIIDEATLGKDTWRKVADKIKGFLN